jgi:hypothetical protein
MALDKNKHLDCVLKSHNIENNESLMKAYRAKRDEVREDLKAKYTDSIYRILHSGSYKKRTAVNIKFDMDLVIPYKKNTDTLEQLYNDLYTYYDTEYRKKDTTLLSVKRQKVAIGLEFLVDGHLLDLDIVPGREINEYEKDGELNLYVNETMGSFKKSSYIKTNIQKQIDNIKDNGEAREPIKLMKIWKRRNNGNIKSFVIELITVRAMEEFDDEDGCSRWDVLKHVIGFIRDNIQSVKLVDPGNGNNVVSDSLSDFEKQSISDRMKWMLDDIENNDSSLERYFPVNAEYPCDEEKRNLYIISPEKKPDQLNDEDFG